MDTPALRDLVARDRDAGAAGPALVYGPAREVGYGEFAGAARKTANLLRFHGAGRGASVAVADDPAPPVVYGLFGAGLLGARVTVGRVAADASAVLAPPATLDEWPVPAGAKPVAYGDEHADPAVAQFATDVWSENAALPPDAPGPDHAFVADAPRDAVLAGAATAAETLALSPGDLVAVRAPLAAPGVVAAGVLAPLAAGATVLLPGDETTVTGTVAVTTAEPDAVPEPRAFDPGALDSG